MSAEEASLSSPPPAETEDEVLHDRGKPWRQVGHCEIARFEKPLQDVLSDILSVGTRQPKEHTGAHDLSGEVRDLVLGRRWHSIRRTCHVFLEPLRGAPSG